jgi:hypothetical protein
MSPPTYVIKAHTDFVAMYSGHAFFENGPMAVGKVGEFSNVYGKKRARETCAEMVLEYLEGVAGNRAGRAGSGIGERGERVPDFEGGESFE